MTAPSITLREVTEADLDYFFELQRDPTAGHMAAFTRKDPEDRQEFDAHWGKILRSETVVRRTILHDGEPAGHVMCYGGPERPEVTYWVDRKHWGRGVATRALRLLIEMLPERPLYARAAADNAASLRVLEKCGFGVTGSERSHANARGTEIEEMLLELR